MSLKINIYIGQQKNNFILLIYIKRKKSEDNSNKVGKKSEGINDSFPYRRLQNTHSSTKVILNEANNEEPLGEKKDDNKSEDIQFKTNSVKAVEKDSIINPLSFSIKEEENNNNEYKKTTTTLETLREKESTPNSISNDKKKEKSSNHLNVFNISVIDFFLYNFGFKKMKGSSMIEISERITKDSLSCEQIIKNNISIEKIIKLLDEKQKEKFIQMKPEFIKKMEQKKLIFSTLIRNSVIAVNPIVN